MHTHTPKVERRVIKTVDYDTHMSLRLVEEWGDGIPTYAEADPTNPEWRATPVIPVDFTSDGYGMVHVKNEADRKSNPTGTMKDRPAWELATVYRDSARSLHLKLRANRLSTRELTRLRVPRCSFVTMGNEGRAVAECFARYNLPPPKLIMDVKTPVSYLEVLRQLRADIYLVDLGARALTPEDIHQLAGNGYGIDITSTRVLEVHAVFYDWLVHEVFNERPDEVYVPYGSGRLMENFLTWQARTLRNAVSRRPDPRLRVPLESVIAANIFGAEPADPNSRADKCAAPFKPFLLFQDADIQSLVSLSYTGSQTSRQQVEESYVERAYALLRRHVDTEPSAAMGLALYFKRFERGLVRRDANIMVVNTGCGLVAAPQ